MKKFLLITATVFFIQICNAQVDSMYFGQTPPGDSAVMFAPDIISLPNRLEAKITFSPDSTKCYFEVVNLVKVGGTVTSVNYKIYYTNLVDSSWTEQIEAPFSVNNSLGSPYFSSDGKKLYFNKHNSDQTSSDISMVQDSAGGWSYPQLLPEPINSASMELSYAETTDSIIYFDSNRPDGNGGYDIWCKRPSFGQAENLGPIVNSTAFDSDPCIAPDGSYLIFSTERYYSLGGNLLCISFNKGNNEWTVPINLNNAGAKINNIIAHHGSPSLSPDGKYLFFSRHSVDTIMDLYWVSTHIIVGLKKDAFAPKKIRQIPNMNITTDSTINYVIPENTFSCEYGTASLKYTATLKNGSALPDWLHFDTETRTLSGTPEQAETDSVKITVTNKDTASASCTFRINVSSKVGISQLDEKEFEIFPNPTNGQLTLSFGNTIKKAVVEIYNLDGRQIFSQTYLNTAITTVDLTGNTKDMYLLRLNLDGTIYNNKVCLE